MNEKPTIDELERFLASETDVEEKANILRTIKEIVANEPLELPSQTLEEWEQKLAAEDRALLLEKQRLIY